VVDTLSELVQEYTDLEEPIVEHLQRLVASWGVLSDLCFADLLLFAPARGRVDLFVALGQVRPTTSQTLHPEDLVGQVSGSHDRPLLARAWQLGSVVEGEVAIPRRGEHARLVCIPVRRQGRLVGLLTRESALVVGRRSGQLERVYVEVFDRLARMIATGAFPYPVDEIVTAETPRVGDGVVVLDPSARVDYASPNAVSAFHRLGVKSGIEGIRLDEAGLDESAVSLAYESRLAVTKEIGYGSDTTVVIRCMPLLDNGTVTGALVLMHDVSELRRRDRLLLSKDAAIREVHHRVKNNLQTISSLLRLQSRRMAPGEPRSALEEAERRVRSIAVVHEILSRDTVDEVDFNDILPSLVRMAEDLGRVDRPVQITCRGEAGQLHASVATPLAVVITELLQNAAEHGWPEPGAPPDLSPPAVTADAQGASPEGASQTGAQSTSRRAAGDEVPPTGARPLQVVVELRRTDGELRVTVRDDGAGLPPGFSIDNTSGLGLSIVRGLVRTQLGGVISMHGNGGTVVDVAIPVDHPTEDLENL
jgi:two-component sensor histidine kinase